MTDHVPSWAFIQLKPGTGKTTSAVFLAHALKAAGRNPLLVDADKAQSALRWSDQAGGFEFPIVGLAVANVHQQMPGLLRQMPRVDCLVFDTPQAEDHAPIVRSVMRLPGQRRTWILPIAPAGVEVDRMAPMRQHIEDGQSLRRDDDGPADVVVMLNRTNRPTRTSTGPDHDVREALIKRGYAVLDTQIAHNDSLYRQTFGTVPDIEATTFPALADELLARQEGTA